jgi:hypothetical protein
MEQRFESTPSVTSDEIRDAEIERTIVLREIQEKIGTGEIALTVPPGMTDVEVVLKMVDAEIERRHASIS